MKLSKLSSLLSATIAVVSMGAFAQENFVGEVALFSQDSSPSLSESSSESATAVVATSAAAGAIVLTQADSGSATPATDSGTTADDSEIPEDVSTQDQYSLPRSAAPVAVDTNLRAGSPIGSNTQSALTSPPGVKVDSATGFFPSLSIGVSWTDNPARVPGGSEDDDQEDYIYSFAPSLVYRGAIKNRHAYQLAVAGYTDSYDTFTNLDTDTVVYSAAINLDISKIAMADLYYNHTDSADPRGATATRIIDPTAENDKYKRDSYGGRVTFGRRSNRFQAVLGTQLDEIEYTNNGQEVRDREDSEVNAGLFWNTGPRTSLFTRVRVRDIDYIDPRSTSFDSEETHTTVGAGWEPSFNTSLIVEYGNLQKEFDSPEQEEFDSDTYTGRLRWSPWANTTLGFFASRRTEETTDRDASFIVSELFGANIQHSFTNRFRAGAYVNYIEDELINVRDDEILDYGLNVSYDWFRWLTMGAGWSHTERDSTDTIADYESDTYYITASFYTRKPISFGSVQTSDQANPIGF